MGSGIHYSGAQDIPGKIEKPNLPPSVIDENGEEPEVQAEEPEVKAEEPTLKDDGQSQAQPQPQQGPTPIEYQTVKVEFLSITIHNDEEPAPFDDGEYTMRAVVNGKYVDLDKGSGLRLWDVSPGETITFAPYTYAIVKVPIQKPEFPLSIYTLGFEADVCQRADYGNVAYNPNIIPILQRPSSYLSHYEEWLTEIRRIIDYDTFGRTSGEFNCHDRIGYINKIHFPLSHTGWFTVKSTNPDDPENPNGTPNFTLKYKIGYGN